MKNEDVLLRQLRSFGPTCGGKFPIALNAAEVRFSSSAAIQIPDINGQLIQAGYATETTTRFQ
jgi:hypothetical protein